MGVQERVDWLTEERVIHQTSGFLVGKELYCFGFAAFK